MTNDEYIEAKKTLTTLQYKSNNFKKLPRVDFEGALYLLITVHGHAWCMDEVNERRKMAKLISKALR